MLSTVSEQMVEDAVQDPHVQVYRLVIIDPKSRTIFCKSGERSFDLVKERIPKGERTALAATSIIRERYGISTIQLAVIRQEHTFPCAIHEVVEEHGPIKGHAYCPLRLAAGLWNDEQRRAALAIVNDAELGLGPFAKIGWLKTLEGLVGTCEMRDISHWNCSGDFSLLSFLMKEERFWFKAVGVSKRREYLMTKLLALRVPEYLPSFVYDFPQWNGWIAKDAGGHRLSDATSLREMEQAFEGLAELQLRSTGFLEELRSLGAVDWSAIGIRKRLDPFLADASLAMQAQTSFRLATLNDTQLAELRRDVEMTLDEFITAGVPDTLVHGDMGHGNVLVTPRGPVFLDWAESYFGNPFLSAEHLLADLERQHCIDRFTSNGLWEVFASRWGIDRGTSGLRERSAGVAAFVYGMFAWESWQSRQTPKEGWHLLRSVLRRSASEFQASKTLKG